MSSTAELALRAPPADPDEVSDMTALTLDTLAPELTRQDRCDRCGAQAFVKATIPTADGMELLFCGHHFRAHELKLVAAGATIQDERHRIDEQAAERV
ncbi:DUF7455 domain-containing protein [Cellulomonas sp. Leaf395]|uniref:DUF7455 domain-containing protein n=1 Tax=Cellulomonas sp. Leaf395 TaxID=1736362 RepID=UPI002E119171